MSQHDDLVRLHHMLDHAREAVDLSQGRSRLDLDANRLLELALLRLLEVIGEAANRLSADFQRQHSHIPWVQIISLRNRLIHGSDAVDLDILWEVVTKDLPALASSLKEIISSGNFAVNNL